jgi:hypothetical protein
VENPEQGEPKRLRCVDLFKKEENHLEEFDKRSRIPEKGFDAEHFFEL